MELLKSPGRSGSSRELSGSWAAGSLGAWEAGNCCPWAGLWLGLAPGKGWDAKMKGILSFWGGGLAAGATIGPPGKTKGSLHGTIKNDTFWGCSPWEAHLDTPELKLLEVFFNSPSVRLI